MFVALRKAEAMEQATMTSTWLDNSAIEIGLDEEYCQMSLVST